MPRLRGGVHAVEELLVLYASVRCIFWFGCSLSLFVGISGLCFCLRFSFSFGLSGEMFV
jgi:hypothetical protein